MLNLSRGQRTSACHIRVRGVGFRPFVYRLAHANRLAGWVANDEIGVEIHLEGSGLGLDRFLHSLASEAPAAASIDSIDVDAVSPSGMTEFSIQESSLGGHPTVRASADLPVCDTCLAELFDPANPRFLYPYINCTNCGPRYSVILGLPYDRANTTMRLWPLDGCCMQQYTDPRDRRFHRSRLHVRAADPITF